MANRLIRYDARLLRRFLADGFGGPADVLLLVLVVTIGAAWLRQQVLALPPGAVWLALLAGPAGLAWQPLVPTRLAGLAERSPVAPAALARRERRAWLAAAHLLPGLPLLAGAILLGLATGRPWPAIGLAVIAYAAGAGLASILPAIRPGSGPGGGQRSVMPLGRGPRAVIALVLARQCLGTRRPLLRAGLLLAASFMLTAMAGWWGRSMPAPLALILPFLPPLAVLLLTTRLDAALLAFLPAVGYRPGFIALAVAGLPAGSFLVAAIAFLLTGQGLGAIALLALGHLAFALVAIARAWLYPGRTKRSVELRLQLELTGLAAAAIMLPPLAIAAACWRLWHLHRHCRARRWLQA